MELENRLKVYCEDSYYPFHMPGHKRNPDFSMFGCKMGCYDITEIPGFDNLANPSDILKEEQDRISAFYGCDKTFLLVNGCTGGVLSAMALVYAMYGAHTKVLMGRNCHRSVYNALCLNNLIPVYMWPEYFENSGILCGIGADEVKDFLNREPDIKALVITSPTYEGVLSDMNAIAKVCHEKGVMVIVDEAHGAHLGAEGFPMDSVRLGCDIVIHGLHKTLPALTQTAVMHVNAGIADIGLLGRIISMYQTSSPSYILMTSAVKAMDIYMNGTGFKEYYSRLMKLRSELRENLTKLSLFEPYEIYDPSKIVIMTNGYMDGAKLASMLRARKLEIEMAAPGYIICMTSVGDTNEGFSRLKMVLFDIDASIKEAGSHQRLAEMSHLRPRIEFAPCDAFAARRERVVLRDAIGRICASNICVYPPGVPMIATGEVFDGKVIDMLSYYVNSPYEVIGIDKEGCVEVVSR